MRPAAAPRRRCCRQRNLKRAYFDLRDRIDQIVSQAEQQGSLTVALSGLNSVRHTLDSLARLAGHDRAGGSQVNVAVQTNVHVDLNADRRAADQAVRS